MDCSTPGFPVSHHLLELAQTHVHWVSDVIQPSRLLSSPSPPAFNLSQHQGFFPMSQLFASGGQRTGASNFSISPSYEYSGLISFKMDWFDLLAVQGTLSSLLQHHSSIKSINSSVLCLLYGPALTSVHVLEGPQPWLYWLILPFSVKFLSPV